VCRRGINDGDVAFIRESGTAPGARGFGLDPELHRHDIASMVPRGHPRLAPHAHLCRHRSLIFFVPTVMSGARKEQKWSHGTWERQIATR